MDIQNATLNALAQADQYTQWILNALLPWMPPIQGRILEIGCGIGSYSTRLLHYARHLVAIDIEPTYVTAAEKNLTEDCAARGQTLYPSFEVHCLDLFEESAPPMPFLDEPFQSIVMLNVLEHLPDDGASLRRMAKWLDPESGRLLLWVPALPVLMSPYDRSIGHYRRYTKTSLEAVLQQNGFTVEHCRYHNFMGIFGWWLQFCLLQQTQFNLQSVGVFNRLAPFLFRLEQTLQPPVGLSLLAVARRIAI